MNRLSRVDGIPARSMKRNGLRAKSWGQRRCRVGEGWNRKLLGMTGGIRVFLIWYII